MKKYAHEIISISHAWYIWGTYSINANVIIYQAWDSEGFYFHTLETHSRHGAYKSE